MSSPGVIKLAENIICNQIFRVEDNIGEAIHIHWGNIRIDLTISEFLDLADSLGQIMIKMMSVPEFDFENYDAIFLSQIAKVLINLQEIRIEERNINELLTDDYDSVGKIKMIGIEESRVSKALHGDATTIQGWKQTNYLGESNIERFLRINDSVKLNGYIPEKKSYVVVFDEGNFVADGCHRVSCLNELNSKMRIKVADFITRNGSESDKKKIFYFSQYNDSIDANLLRIEKQKNIVKIVLEKYFENKTILIKGGGRHTEEILKLLTNNSLIKVYGIVDKRCESIKNCVDESKVEWSEIDYIFISSYRYREEMKNEMKDKFPQIPIFDIYDHVTFGEFFS